MREKQRNCRFKRARTNCTPRPFGWPAFGGKCASDFRSRCASFFKGMRSSFSGSSVRWARKSGLGENSCGLPRLSKLMPTLSAAIIANYSMIYAHARHHWRRWWCFWVLIRCQKSFHANRLALSSSHLFYIHLMNTRLNAANKVLNDARVAQAKYTFPSIRVVLCLLSQSILDRISSAKQ